MRVSEAELRKQGAIKGFYAGCVILFINILSFYFITAFAFPFWLITVGLNVLLFIIYLVIASVFTLLLRTSAGGYWAFKQAVAGIFILVAVAYLINFVGRDVLFANVIEPNMAPKAREAIVKADVVYMNRKGLSQDSIKKSLAELDKKIATVDKVSGLQKLASIPALLIMLFVVSLVLAAIFKKDPPVYRTAGADPTA